jgi:hypothetical protein
VDSPEGATVNIESVKRYPLEWPIGWKRTTYRKAAPFFKQVRQYTETGSYARKESLSVGDATTRLMGELKRLGARHVIISSNLRVREDGLPYAQQAKQIPDPGVAVYFQLSGQPRVLACDKWSSVADNLAAIAGHIEAIRACDRYGVGTLEQAFTGYKALPADSAADWRMVLFGEKDCHVTVGDVQAAYRARAKELHPDVGGTEIAMSHLNRARDYALMELEGR